MSSRNANNRRPTSGRVRLQVLILLVILSGVLPLNAQQPAKKQSKRTTVDFTDQLVEGKADKPELFYLLQNRNANNKRLIRLREDFLPEMRRSAEDVGRRTKGGQK